MNLANSAGPGPNEVLYISFNQDASSVCVGTRTGYRLYALNTLDRLELVHSINTEDVCLIQRLFQCSLAITVSLSAPRRLKVSHFKKGTEICNYCYPNTILCIKLNRLRLVVVLEESLYIHNVRDMKVLHTIRDTPPNVNGICAFSINDFSFLAYPGSSQIGEVQVFDGLNLRATAMIQAHNSPVAALEFNSIATLLATASDKGTVIRVFSIPEGQRLYEFRRGMKRFATIHSLAFNQSSTLLCCSSNTETVHIFKLEVAKENVIQEDSQSWMGVVSKALWAPASYLPAQVTEIFNQNRDFASAKLPNPGMKTIAVLANINKAPRLLVASADGFLYAFNLDLEAGGECTLIKQFHLVDDCSSKPAGGSDEPLLTSGAGTTAGGAGASSSDSHEVRQCSPLSPSQPTPTSALPDRASSPSSEDTLEFPPLGIHNT